MRTTLACSSSWGGAGIGGRRARAASSAALGGAAVLAPQIEVIGERERAGVVPRLLAGERTRAVVQVVGPLLALDRQIAVHLGASARTCDARHRHRFAHARLRRGEAWIVRLSGLDPRVELRIAIDAPLVGGGHWASASAARIALPASSEARVGTARLRAMPPVLAQPAIVHKDRKSAAAVILVATGDCTISSRNDYRSYRAIIFFDRLGNNRKDARIFTGIVIIAFALRVTNRRRLAWMLDKDQVWIRFKTARVFVRVSRRAVFTGAAQHLHTTTAARTRRARSPIWKCIYCARALLSRTTRRIPLTEAGRAYLQRCEQILAYVDQAESRGAATRTRVRPAN